jgi:hypothetical protein
LDSTIWVGFSVFGDKIWKGFCSLIRVPEVPSLYYEL